MAKAKKATGSELSGKPLRSDASCERCKLNEKSATVCCESVGPKNAPIFLVGEALGATEEELGRPFVGDAGFKLNYLLTRAGLNRKELRIGNCVRCRPPGNSIPTKKQLTACYPYLLYDILIGKPKVIVALGATAINNLMPGVRNVDKSRGFPEEVTFTWTSRKGAVFEHQCWVVPTYHPSACLRDWRYDDLAVRDFEIVKELAATGCNPLAWPDTKVTVIKTFKGAMDLIRKLRTIGRFVLDLETTGFDPHTAKILCIGLCWKTGQATVLPLRKQGDLPFWKPQEFRAIVDGLTELLQEVILYGQNIKFDIKFLRALTGITEFSIGFDTMNAHHCVDENKPHNLTFLCQWYLRWQKYDALMQDYHGRSDGFASVPDAMLWRYCGYDVDGTWRVRRALIKELKAEKTTRPFKTELGLINPLADIEYRGIRVDLDKISTLSAKYRADIVKAKSYLKRVALKKMGQEWYESRPKGEFNPNSPPQLAALLAQCGAKMTRKTTGGAVSTDKIVMDTLALGSGTPATIARKMKEIRTLTKYISTYLDGKDGDGGFKQWVRSKNRIHANYNTAIARTGRLSADDPPLQTVPRLGDLRSIFLPDCDDHLFLSIDYQKVELCVMAYLANDEVMARELIEQQDLHSRMALTKRLNRDPTDEEWAAFMRIEKLIKENGVEQDGVLQTDSSTLSAMDLAHAATLQIPVRGKNFVGLAMPKNERSLAKGVNFGIPYGIGASAVVDQNPDAFPLKMSKQTRKKLVLQIMDAYFEKYYGVAEYRQKQIRIAHKTGAIRTLLGRKRRLTGIQWFKSRWAAETERCDLDLSHLEREAMNMGVQSFASDFLSEKTRHVAEGIRDNRIPTLRPVMTLHDQLVFNVHERYKDDAIPMLTELMEDTLPQTDRFKYAMPIRVDVAVQRFWGEREY